MADRTIARRYAKAFLELAQETDAVDALGKDLSTVLGAIESTDGLLLRVLANPVFTREERMNVLDAVLPKLGLQQMTANLLHLLVERGKFAALGEIATVYFAAADEAAGRARVRVTTAEPLSPQLEAEVRAALEKATGKQVLLDTTVDPDLLGGMVARVEGRVYDASLRTRLQNIKQELLAHTAAAEA